jgi:fucose permease
MTRLNLFWALGACSGPWLVLQDGVRDAVHIEHFLQSLAVVFAIFGIWAMAFEKDPAEQARTQNPRRRFVLSTVPWPLLVLVFSATGVESSCGGWLATYSQRSSHSLGITIGAPTCFWAGSLVSRFLHSISRFGRATRNLLLTWNLVTMAAAVAALIVLHRGSVMLAAAFLVGFSVGPMYPLLLALVFKYDNGSLIFVLAGLGAASLPLLTGTISAATGSLRAGLVAPGIAAVAMALAGWSVGRGRGSPETDAVVSCGDFSVAAADHEIQ